MKNQMTNLHQNHPERLLQEEDGYIFHVTKYKQLLELYKTAFMVTKVFNSYFGRELHVHGILHIGTPNTE